MRIALAFVAVIAVIAALIGVLLLVAEDPGSPGDLDPAPSPPGGSAPSSREPAPAPSGPSGPTAPPAASGPETPAPTGPVGPIADPTAARVVSAFRKIPIAGARVLLWRDGEDPTEARTDQLGQIPLAAGLAPGLNLRIDADRFRTLQVVLDDHLTGRAFVLEPVGVIQGEVVDSRGVPQPWANLKLGVIIEDATGATLGVPWSKADRVTCDKEGRFRLEALDPRGRYLIVASLARLGSGVKSDVVPAAPEERRVVRVKLGGDGELRVLVTDRSGAPVPVSRAMLSGRPAGLPDAVVVGPGGRALVDLMKQLRFRYRRAMTGSTIRLPDWKSGYGYVFNHMPPGDYVLEIEARGFKPYSARIEVERTGPAQHEAHLVPEDVALTGVVMDAFGAPVAQADMSVHTDGDAFRGYQSTASGPDGSFVIRGPTQWIEPLVLQVAKDGFDTTLVRVAPDSKRLTIRLQQSGRVRGEVALENQETGEVVFEFVRSLPQAALERRTHLVRRNWKQFVFTLPRGTYTVRASAVGFRDHRAQVTVPSGGEAVMGGFVLRRK